MKYREFFVLHFFNAPVGFLIHIPIDLYLNGRVGDRLESDSGKVLLLQ
jgi:hypothetical protein